MKYFEDIALLKQTYYLVKPYALGAHKVRLHILNQNFETLTYTQYPLSVIPWTSFTPGTSHIHFGVPGSDSFTPMDQIRRQELLPIANPPPPTLFSVPLKDLTPLPASIPAILIYLALSAYGRSTNGTGGSHHDLLVDIGSTGTNRSFLAFPAGTSELPQDNRWEYEWTRALPVEPTVADINPTLTFRPGSLEGYWEGVFSVCAPSLLSPMY